MSSFNWLTQVFYPLTFSEKQSKPVHLVALAVKRRYAKCGEALQVNKTSSDVFVTMKTARSPAGNFPLMLRGSKRSQQGVTKQTSWHVADTQSQSVSQSYFFNLTVGKIHNTWHWQRKFKKKSVNHWQSLHVRPATVTKTLHDQNMFFSDSSTSSPSRLLSLTHQRRRAAMRRTIATYWTICAFNGHLLNKGWSNTTWGIMAQFWANMRHF